MYILSDLLHLPHTKKLGTSKDISAPNVILLCQSTDSLSSLFASVVNKNMLFVRESHAKNNVWGTAVAQGSVFPSWKSYTFFAHLHIKFLSNMLRVSSSTPRRPQNSIADCIHSKSLAYAVLLVTFKMVRLSLKLNTIIVSYWELMIVYADLIFKDI